MSDVYGDAAHPQGEAQADEVSADAGASYVAVPDTRTARPPSPQDEYGAPRRDPETRRRDHDAIHRLTDAVLPDLIDRLASSGLGEIEVREDDWRIRLRRPSTTTRGGDRAA